jgi:hypothetical protein
MRRRDLLFVTLCISIVCVSAIFGVAFPYSQPIRLALIVVGLAAVFVPALLLTISLAMNDISSRATACAGLALIAPVGLFAVLPGFGPPDAASPSDNYVRYVILLAGSVCLGFGLIVLSATAEEEGSAVLGRIAHTAALLAAPLYIIWATVLVQIVTIMSLPSHPSIVPWLGWVSAWSDIVLFAAGLLTYLCAAALCPALFAVGKVGKGAAVAFSSISLVAAALLLMRGLVFSSPATAFRHWYSIPGWVAGIPAVPWLIPAFLGAICLRGGFRGEQPKPGPDLATS